MNSTFELAGGRETTTFVCLAFWFSVCLRMRLCSLSQKDDALHLVFLVISCLEIYISYFHYSTRRRALWFGSKTRFVWWITYYKEEDSGHFILLVPSEKGFWNFILTEAMLNWACCWGRLQVASGLERMFIVTVN